MQFHHETIEEAKVKFLQTKADKRILVLTGILTFVYFGLIAFAFTIGNMVLFALLIAGEVFHLFQVAMYLYTVWETDHVAEKDESFAEPVDIFVTVVSEPVEIVRETIEACKAMTYPNFKVHILNDGLVAKKDNWMLMEELAQELGVNCITRKVPGGAKAGNINHALEETTAPFVVIFDADHVPHPDFLQKVMPYFVDPKMAFVQSPQFYKNFQLNFVTQSAWEQQELFFGPICKGKNRLNAATMSGTNMAIRRTALLQAGGMSPESIAEDFLTGLKIHAAGWKSVFVPEVLAEGLAPEDFLSYYKQQFRWARGALDVVFSYNVVFKKGLTMHQRLQYISSVSFYFSGLVVLMNALIPIAFFFTGAVPFLISNMVLAAVFLPYIFLMLYILQSSSNFTFTFKALVFSMAGFTIHLKALWEAVTRKKSKFVVTPKRQQTGNFINLVIPQILYICLVAVGMYVAFQREGFSASFVTNTAWAMLNVGVFIPFIHAALPKKATAEEAEESASMDLPGSSITDEVLVEPALNVVEA